MGHREPCEGWTVRVVAGRITMPLQMSLSKAMLGTIRHGGNFDGTAEFRRRVAA
jgi:hypothetical protein